MVAISPHDRYVRVGSIDIGYRFMIECNLRGCNETLQS
jgi:hypothetical protein